MPEVSESKKYHAICALIDQRLGSLVLGGDYSEVLEYELVEGVSLAKLEASFAWGPFITLIAAKNELSRWAKEDFYKRRPSYQGKDKEIVMAEEDASTNLTIAADGYLRAILLDCQED